MRFSASAFTLIELLIVVSIIGVLSLIGYANLGSTKEEKSFLNVAEEIQSLIKTAQTNATSVVVCGRNPNAAKWFVSIVDNKTLRLGCYHNIKASQAVCGVTPESTDSKTLELSRINPNTVIETVIGSPNNAGTINITICFSPLLSEVDTTTITKPVEFYHSASSAFSNNSDIRVNLKNNKTNRLKTVILNKGGAINVQ